MELLGERFDFLSWKAGRQCIKIASLSHIAITSSVITCSKLGIDFVGCGPRKFFPRRDLVRLSRKFSDKHDSDVIYTDDLEEAVADADIIYTDMWISLTEKENPPMDRIRRLYPYRVTREFGIISPGYPRYASFKPLR